RRLVHDRRSRLGRRERLSAHHRPQQGRHHPRRPQYLPGQDRGARRQSRRRAKSRRGGGAGSTARRTRVSRRDVQARQGGIARGDSRASGRRRPVEIRDAGVLPACRRDPAHRQRQGAQARRRRVDCRRTRQADCHPPAGKGRMRDKRNPTMSIAIGRSIIGAALSLVLFASAALAQSYPNRPVRLILPYNPGGIVDYVGRSLGQHLGEALGATVVPENRPGAGGILGTEVTARAQPDGYTLLLMDNAIVINPSLQEHVPYDFFKQIDAISWVSSSPLVLVVTPDLKVKSFDEFVAYAKANPGKLNFATAGVGTAPHLAAEMFKQRTGINAVHVPYKGIGASYIDLMSNKIQFAFSSIAGALPFTTDNRVLPLATTGETRSEVYPDKPTMAEAG